MRLADHPRNTTAIGAPAIALKLNQLLIPNLAAGLMNGFMDNWGRKADSGEDSNGALFEPPTSASGIDGGRRPPARRRKVGIMGVGAVLGGLAVIGVFAMRNK
ncbi:hypothetical protein [Sphingomonas fuzhouensis]|uniref:hypothetical protein n=1 Tax=Sphingomonas fuzhouensis TaxID=3106033 RepID=UPI002AFDE59B|nr:hypothetical protein [Sphingomonas sp. SGZ-02]